MLVTASTLPLTALSDFCRRWKISELALFGSALREDFNLDSDIDLLATFAPDAAWSLFDHVRMELELGEILGRKVDLVGKDAVEASHNPILQREILGAAEVVYAA